MKRALGVSAIVHLLVIGVVYAAARERPAGAPVRIYTVDVVNWQTGPRGGPGTTSPATAVRTPAPARPSQPAQATTRSGVKTPTAPSRETEAPRGQRRLLDRVRRRRE